MLIYFNAVRCHPLYVKICQIMKREYRSLLLEKKKKQVKALGAVEEMSASELICV